MNILVNTTYKFWLYKSKINKEGKSPLYMRIIVGQDKIEIATGIFLKEQDWVVECGRVSDKVIDSDIFNLKIEGLIKAFKETYKHFLESNLDFTPEIFKNRMLGKDKVYNSLVPLFEYHNAKMAELVGIDYAPATMKRFKTTLNHVKEFLNHKFNSADIFVSQLNLAFLIEFEFYFKTVKGCNHNSTVKYIKNLRKVIHHAIISKFIDNDPFMGYKAKMKPVIKDILTPEEVELIENKIFDFERLENVKKIFLFMCYSGLAYIDVANLKYKNIIELKGKKWIFASRTKTDIPFSIPLIRKALALVGEGDAESKLFDVPSNQKMNAYLKEIADLCKIKKNITCHTSRRTFATSALNNNVSIESVSSMLGHRKLSTTQIYGKIQTERLLTELKKMDK